MIAEARQRRRATRIISWNLLHTIGASVEDVAHLIERERPDLLLMQETTTAIDRLTSMVGGHYARDPLPDRRHGLATWSAKPFHIEPAPLALQRGMVVKRVCQIVALPDFAIANVHLSHGQILNRRQLHRISRHLPAHAMIIGDCNMVGPSLLPGYSDMGPRMATHNAGRIIPLRLDRCFVRGLTVLDAALLNRGTSDHRPMVVSCLAD